MKNDTSSNLGQKCLILFLLDMLPLLGEGCVTSQKTAAKETTTIFPRFEHGSFVTMATCWFQTSLIFRSFAGYLQHSILIFANGASSA